MKIVLNLTSEEILESSDRTDRQELYENLEEEFREDVEDLVDKATSMEKRNIFDSLRDDGYGDDLISKDEITDSIESKRWMMDKADDDMLMHLIEKYKYYG